MRWLLRVCCGVVVAAAQEARTVLYDRKLVPKTWQKGERVPGSRRVDFTLALMQNGLQELESLFWEVSDPHSVKYRQFVSAADADAMTASDAKHHDLVLQWLQTVLDKSGSGKIEKRSDTVVVLGAKVSEIERLFQTRMFFYRHDNGHTIIRNFGPYSIPTSLSRSIEMVEGIADFPMHRRTHWHNVTRSSSGLQGANVVPQTLAVIYNFTDSPAPSKAKQMPAEFQDDRAFSESDLEMFYSGVNIANQTITDIIGPFNGSLPDAEASLDIQFLSSVGMGIDNWYWTSKAWMYTFANNLLNNPSGLPDVVSISWGYSEMQQCAAGIAQGDCSTLGIDSETYVRRTNIEFQKLGLAGVSLFAASGDSGANSAIDSNCSDPTLHAVFPAGSPYVTSVGATQFSTYTPGFTELGACQQWPPCAASGTEEAVSYELSGFTSGGGFSNISTRPDYQKSAVEAYLQHQSANLPPASMFNASGRGYPDVSSSGSNLLSVWWGGFGPTGGTSGSAPTWAGLAARLVDIAREADGKPLGFLNPLLYKMQAENPATFQDITVGDNKCTMDGCAASCQGYTAANGWDPVTGLGTPNYGKMSEYLSDLFASAELTLV